MSGNGAADLGQSLAEVDEALELRLVTHARPIGVIAVLLAPAGIASGRLDVSVGARADPHVGPCRWNDEALDAGERAFVLHPATGRRAIAESLAGSLATEALLVVCDETQAGFLGAGSGRGGDFLSY